MAGETITQQVLFELGVTGQDGTITKIGNTAIKFAALAAVAREAVQAIGAAVDSAGQFGDVIKNTQTDMSNFLMETKGLISAMGAYQSANKLTTAGIGATADQMNALGKAATVMADRLGTDATQEMDKLTDAVIRASARGLVPYGIQLESTGDKAKDQAIVLEMLAEKFRDVNVEIGNASELMEVLGNTIQTTQDMLVDGALSALGDTFFSAVGGLEAMNTTLMQFNNSLIQSEGKLGKWMFSLKGLANTILGVFIEAQRMMPWGRAAAYVADKLGLDTSFLNFAAENQYKQEQKFKKEGAMAKQERALENVKVGKNKVGGSSKKEDIMEFTLEETLEPEQERMNQMARVDFAIEEERKRAAVAETARLEDVYLERWKAQVDQRVADRVTAAENEKRIEAEKYAAMTDTQRQYYDQEKAWAQMSAKEKVEMGAAMSATIGGQFGQIAAMQDKSSRKGFEISKNMQLAQATMTLPQAILNAWNTGMQFGPASVVMAPALVASTTALGIAQIAAIKKQKFGGSSAPSSSGSVSSPSVSAPSGGLNNYGNGNASASTTLVSNIVLDGNVIVRSMLRSNADAAQRGEPSFQVSQVA